MNASPEYVLSSLKEIMDMITELPDMNPNYVYEKSVITEIVIDFVKRVKETT